MPNRRPPARLQEMFDSALRLSAAVGVGWWLGFGIGCQDSPPCEELSQEECDANPSCDSLIGEVIEPGTQCRRTREFGACLAAETLCTGAFTTYMNPEGACWLFNGGCLHDSFPEWESYASGCPTSSEFSQVPECE